MSQIQTSDIAEVQEQRASQAANLSRRDFLKAGGAGLLLIHAVRFDPRIHPRIAIVGAGIAGLACALSLNDAGYPATIYEASARTGGRIISSRNKIGEGLTVELGGEFIDSNHTTMQAFAKRFGLELESVEDPALAKHSYVIQKKHYSEHEVVEAFRAIVPKLESDLAQLPKTLDRNSGPIARTFDMISLGDYLDSLGGASWFIEMLRSAYTTEYGLDVGEQSALNLLSLISTDTTADRFNIFGASDECCRVKGGNDLIVKQLAASVGEVKHGMTLVRVAERGKSFALDFARAGASTKRVIADRLVLAIPFSVLRNVEMNVEFPPLKVKAIKELGYGTNAKLITGYTAAPWRTVGSSGYTFTDEAFLTGWEAAHDPGSNASAYSMLLGGRTGVRSGDGTTRERAAEFVPALDRAYSGAQSAFTGNALRMHWPTNPNVMGCYACYRPGQMTDFGGVESEPVGNIFFAGEHTSADNQGFMEGAARSGQLAAENIIWSR